MTLHPSERPKATASRIHGSRKVLGELFRLKEKAQRALQQRATTLEEKAWLVTVIDDLTALIKSGGKALPARLDATERRTARKRTTRDLAGFRPDERWHVQAYGD